MVSERSSHPGQRPAANGCWPGKTQAVGLRIKLSRTYGIPAMTSRAGNRHPWQQFGSDPAVSKKYTTNFNSYHYTIVSGPDEDLFSFYNKSIPPAPRARSPAAHFRPDRSIHKANSSSLACLNKAGALAGQILIQSLQPFPARRQTIAAPTRTQLERLAKRKRSAHSCRT